MKKVYSYLIITSVLIIVVILLYIFQILEQMVLNLIIINVILYILRTPILSLVAQLFKRRLYRAVGSLVYTVVMLIFLFLLIWVISEDLFVLIVPFLLVAFSINFKTIINNIASGVLLLGSEQFDIDDLVESNNLQGIVKKIDLNYTKIEDFDGTKVIVPNSNVYGSTVIRFTFGKYASYTPLQKKDFKKKSLYKHYIKKIDRLLDSKERVTRYVKSIEILSSIEPEWIIKCLETVFEKYMPIFGKKPEYSFDSISFDRPKFLIYVQSPKTQTVFNFMDAFMRDIVYELYRNDIYADWEEYKKSEKKLGGT